MDGDAHYLYILVAASAVGKSVLINQIKSEGLWKMVNKYSTRDNRGTDDDVIKINDDSVYYTKITEDKQKIRHARMICIKDVCGSGKGVVYYKNDNIYGINIDVILIDLENSNLAVIISDFHIIKQLKKEEKLKDKIKVIYIASTIDERELLKRYKSREATTFDEQSDKTLHTIYSIEKMCSILSSAARLKYLTKIEEVLPLLNEQWNNYVPYFDTIKTRSLNIRMLYNRYVDNIVDIDFAILNFYDLEYMFSQVRNIINYVTKKRKVKAPPLFMVCAAPSSGKATLMEIIGDLGAVNNNIVITPKYAKRERRPATDGRDGMIAIGESRDFNEYIKNPDDIWNWRFHTNITEYAVDHAIIRENINRGIAQIFISNMEQINNAKIFYPDNIVILYLHATHETATKNHIKKKRKDECIIEICKEKCLKKGLTFNEHSARNMIENDPEIQFKFENDIPIQDEYNKKVSDDLIEIKEIHQKFLQYNHLIDHVLLNTGTREDLVEQMINLIKYYEK